jgi:ATP-binding cassette subfamily C protein
MNTRPVDPAASDLPVADRRHVRRAALSLIRRDRSGFPTMIVINCLAAASMIVSPWLLGRMVDEVTTGAPVSTIDGLGATLLGVALIQVFLVRVANQLASRFGERTQARLREQFIDRVLALPPALVERAGIGDLAARGTNDVSTIGDTLREAAPATTIAAIRIVLIIVAALLVDPLLGACGLIGLGGIAVAGRWYLRRARDAYLAHGAANSAIASQLTNSAIGARTIENLRLQQERASACEQSIVQSRAAQNRTLLLRSVLYPSIDISTVLPVVLVLVIGFELIERGTTTIGAVVACVLYMQQLAQPVATFLEWIEQLQSSNASFARVEGIADAVTGSVPGERRVGAITSNRIEARDVSYAYPGHDDVVSSVNLTIEPGERLALVGPSGAGKTTLGRLLAGTDRPRRGSIIIGDVALADLEPEELRSHVLMVTQESHLFLGTVRDNLRIGAESAGDSDLHRALATVEATWINELPDELDTVVGPEGHRLDASQIQQIALARVILANPHTVILDEATALLDPGTARRAERALGAVLEGRTIIAIAHRLQTARAASRVAIMQQGRLVEIGSRPAARCKRRVRCTLALLGRDGSACEHPSPRRAQVEGGSLSDAASQLPHLRHGASARSR